MRASLNEVTLIGNLGADPEYTPRAGGQAARCILSVATNERWVDRSGETKSHTEWHRIIAWGAQADACGSYLRKGRALWVRGRIRRRTYEHDGQTKTAYEIFASQVQFLSDGARDSNNAPAPDDCGEG